MDSTDKSLLLAGGASAGGAGSHGTHHVEDTLGFAQLDTLSTNQRKLGQLTSRMTSILSNFDRRLARLERDIRPVHEDLHRLGRVQRNIQSVQASLGKTLSTFDVIVDEEGAVRAGPNPLDLDPYFGTLTRIADGIAYLSSTTAAKYDDPAAAAAATNEDRVSAKMHDLLDLGARSLIDDVILPLLRDQSHRIDPADYIPLGIPLPTPNHHTAAQIQRLLIFLASLPAHPANPNTSPLAYAIAQLAEVRAEYLLGSTKFLGTSVREYAVEKIGSRLSMGGGMMGSGVGSGAAVVSGSAMFGGMSNQTEEAIYERGSAGVAEWIGAWLEMAEVEYHFLTSLLDASSNQYGSSNNHHSEVSATLAAYLRNTFARALAPSLGFLNSTLSALHSHIRKNLATHMLFLLDVIGVISASSSSSSADEQGMDGLVDGMMQGIMGGGGGGGQGSASMSRSSMAARWEYILSPARLDTEWLLHLAHQHAASNSASSSGGRGDGGGGSGAGAGGQQGQQGAQNNQLFADVSADILARQASGMRATATAVLTKFIDDIRQLPLGRESDVPSTGVNEIAYTGVHYIQHMVEYRDVVTPLLHNLGSGNWLMGSSAAPVLTLSGVTGAAGASQYSQYGAGAQSATQDEADERERGKRGDAVLRRYLVDVAACVCEALGIRSKAIRQTSTASIFLLNNISYVRNALTDRNPMLTSAPTSPTATPSDVIIADYLSSAGEELLAQTLRQANARYYDAWAPLVTYMMEDANAGSSGGGWKAAYPRGGYHDSDKMPTKERFAKFYEALDDLERLHRAYPVGREDRELKERLKKEVGRMICPLYTRFVTKHKSSGFSKDPSKHIRMTPNELEERIHIIFR
ncbi:unnamed protein product [Tilletia controversa]|nr:unnamed protein product [Tilletia controversa]